MPHHQGMGIGALNAVHDVADGGDSEEDTSPSVLFYPYDAHSGGGADGVVHTRGVARQGVGTAQGHKDTVAAVRDVHQVGCRIIADVAYEVYLIDHCIVARVYDDDSVRRPVCDPQVPVVLS